MRRRRPTPSPRRGRCRRRRRGSPWRLSGSGKSCTLTRVGCPGRLPLPAPVGVVADQLLLLRVHADHRLARREMRRGQAVDVAELGVTVGVLRALVLLGRRLQRVAHLMQQLGPPSRGHPEALAPAGRRPAVRSTSTSSAAATSGRPASPARTSSSSASSSPGCSSIARLSARPRRPHPIRRLDPGVDLARPP